MALDNLSLGTAAVTITAKKDRSLDSSIDSTKKKVEGLGKTTNQASKSQENFGRKSSRSRERLIELSRGLEDATIGFGVNGFAGAARGATNNISRFFELIGGKAAIIGTIGITIGAALVGPIERWIKSLKKGESAVDKLQGRLERFKVFLEDLERRGVIELRELNVAQNIRDLVGKGPGEQAQGAEARVKELEDKIEKENVKIAQGLGAQAEIQKEKARGFDAVQRSKLAARELGLGGASVSVINRPNATFEATLAAMKKQQAAIKKFSEQSGIGFKSLREAGVLEKREFQFKRPDTNVGSISGESINFEKFGKFLIDRGIFDLADLEAILEEGEFKQMKEALADQRKKVKEAMALEESLNKERKKFQGILEQASKKVQETALQGAMAVAGVMGGPMGATRFRTALDASAVDKQAEQRQRKEEAKQRRAETEQERRRRIESDIIRDSRTGDDRKKFDIFDEFSRRRREVLKNFTGPAFARDRKLLIGLAGKTRDRKLSELGKEDAPPARKTRFFGAAEFGKNIQSSIDQRQKELKGINKNTGNTVKGLNKANSTLNNIQQQIGNLATGPARAG